MKHVIIILISIILTGCTSRQKQVPDAPRPPMLIVHVNDFSLSTANRTATYIDSEAIKQLYYTVARTAGAIKLIKVIDEGSLQDIYTLNIPKLDTVNTSELDNVFLINKAKAENLRKLQEFQEQADKDIQEYLRQLSESHSYQYSDVAGALSLASEVLQTKTYQAYTRYLLLTTDLLHETKDKNSRLQPIALTNTQVLAVRPSISPDSLTALFPSSLRFTSINDAVQFLNTQNQ